MEYIDYLQGKIEWRFQPDNLILVNFNLKPNISDNKDEKADKTITLVML